MTCTKLSAQHFEHGFGLVILIFGHVFLSKEIRDASFPRAVCSKQSFFCFLPHDNKRESKFFLQSDFYENLLLLLPTIINGLKSIL
jgi:hypothetical protein